MIIQKSCIFIEKFTNQPMVLCLDIYTIYGNLAKIIPCLYLRLKECKMGKGSKTFPHGRDAKTGEFISVKEARRRPNTTTVEQIPKPGFGDTKRVKTKT